MIYSSAIGSYLTLPLVSLNSVLLSPKVAEISSILTILFSINPLKNVIYVSALSSPVILVLGAVVKTISVPSTV